MPAPGSIGPIWRSFTRHSLTSRPYRSTVPVQHGSWRHASTSRVTLKPSPSARANSKSKADASPEPAPTLKPRKLLPPHSGRGMRDGFIDEARRDMQLRRMKFDEGDLKWLKEARYLVYTLNSKLTELQKEHKKVTHELNRHYQAAAIAAKAGKGKGKDKDGAMETQAESTETEAASAKSTDTEVASIEAEAKSAESGASSTDSELSQAAETAPDEKEEKINQLREKGKGVKVELEKVQKQLEEVRERSKNIRLGWPNHCHPDVPVGPEENAVVLSVKDPLDILPKEFDVMKEPWNEAVMQAKHFPDGPGPDPKRDHLSLAASTGSAEVDMISGLLSTGSSWPYLLGSISLLEHALSQYAMSIAVRKGFLAVSPPDVVRADLADRCGFRPRDEKAKQTYFIEGTKSKSPDAAADLCLAATAEIPLAGLLAARTIDNSQKTGKRASSAEHEASLIQRSELPIKLAALGHAFRAEAGARGADTRGLYRVHQFSKIEMFVATDGTVEASNAMLEELRSIQEEVIGGLGLPYRVLDMPTEELGASAYRKYDVEVWMPGRGSWGEVSSASNCTFYQGMRLGINLKNAGTSSKDDGDPLHPTVHTLNATAAATPRLIVAILENHGVEKGRLVLPDTLKPFWLAGDKDPNVTWLYTGKLEAGSQSRLQQALSRVRSIARKNGTDAPTMVASFLLLHELTAIVPLVIMFYVFGALGVGTAVLQWLLGDADATKHDPVSLSSRFRAWARIKEERFERYCRKKGYLGFEKQDAETIDAAKELGQSDYLVGSFANMVAAYILVKALLPLRIAASVALAGPFSRTVLEPLKHVFRRRARATKAAASEASRPAQKFRM